ncbi:siderophore-interacting protein [Nocardioides sp. LMS-CY]|uniref:siderophore-interacting protein n=1 Tax=Nocardioides sp. (strain LMS-CY) TaxID=2840457 RepID=UPI0020795EA2|nr:siderophore-interacting protein [Nocardioides sp. LMS-CY]
MTDADHEHDHEHEDDFTRADPGPRVAAFHADGHGVKRIGYPILVTRGTVVRRTELNPSMLRLTVGGPEFAGFHSHQADDHVKIVFPFPDGTRNDPVVNDHSELDWPRPYPPARKYTVRRYDPDACEVDLDVVLHAGGVASEWARTAAVGDPVVVAGPPGAKAFAHNYDHYVLAVDPTGLPALARWLAESPADVSADVVIDHDHDHERDYPLASRDGVSITWLDRSGGSRLAEHVQALARADGRTFVFAAGEAGDIKPLRRWAREQGLDSLVTGYWKRGVADLQE